MRIMKSSAEFDVIVYGATGFTGRLVAEYLVKSYGPGSDLTWALAGRNAAKLTAIRDEIGASATVALIEADGGNRASLDAMVKRTKVVLTTVGPFQLFGSDLVASCAANGTDYVDLCGEPVWMRQMIDANEAAAKASGARIVFSCGFDSIPSDLGIYFLQETAKQKFGAPCPRVKGRVRKIKGAHSGGTAASLQATLAAAMKDPSMMTLLKDHFSLTPGFTGPKQPSGMRVELDPALDSWVAPFVMAAINTRNVHRTNFLRGHPYGADFAYDEMMATGPGPKGEAIANAIASDKSMMSKDGPKPGEGPSRAEREAGHFDMLFIGERPDGQTVRVGVTGDMDPGYGSTSKMISESAICLVRDVPAGPGGIFTPGAIMAEPLIKRLIANAGLTFQVE
jgi:short subunit dehydrogenase-like uncharacterized protein